MRVITDERFDLLIHFLHGVAHGVGIVVEALRIGYVNRSLALHLLEFQEIEDAKAFDEVQFAFLRHHSFLV